MSKCKSCHDNPVYERGLCRKCRADYAYIMYRRNLEKKQRQNKRPVSCEGKRWSKLERKNIKILIKEALLANPYLKIRAIKVESLFEITRSLVNRILQELQADKKIMKLGAGSRTYYVVINQEV